MKNMDTGVRTRLEAKIIKMNNSLESMHSKVTAEQLFELDPHIEKDPDSFELNSNNQLHNASTRVILQMRDTSPNATGLGEFIEMNDFNGNYEISKIPENAIKLINQNNQDSRDFISGMMIRKKEMEQDVDKHTYLIVYSAEEIDSSVSLNAAEYTPLQNKIISKDAEFLGQYDINPSTLLAYKGEKDRPVQDWQKVMIKSALAPDNIRRHITTTQIDNIIDHAMKKNPNHRLVLLANGIDPDNNNEIEIYNEKISYVPPVKEDVKGNYIDDEIMRRRQVFNDFLRAAGDNHLTDEFSERDLMMVNNYLIENQDSLDENEQSKLVLAVNRLNSQDTVATRQLTDSIENMLIDSRSNLAMNNLQTESNNSENKESYTPKPKMRR